MTDWKVGDLAVCIEEMEPGPIQKGGIYRVSRVGEGFYDGVTIYGSLGFTACDPEWAYHPDWFRRIEPAEPVFIEAMRNLRIKEAA